LTPLHAEATLQNTQCNENDISNVGYYSGYYWFLKKLNECALTEHRPLQW